MAKKKASFSARRKGIAVSVKAPDLIASIALRVELRETFVALERAIRESGGGSRNAARAAGGYDAGDVLRELERHKKSVMAMGFGVDI